MATHSSLLAWKLPWTEEPGGLQSMGLQKVRDDLATKRELRTNGRNAEGMYAGWSAEHPCPLWVCCPSRTSVCSPAQGLITSRCSRVLASLLSNPPALWPRELKVPSFSSLGLSSDQPHPEVVWGPHFDHLININSGMIKKGSIWIKKKKRLLGSPKGFRSSVPGTWDRDQTYELVGYTYIVGYHF